MMHPLVDKWLNALESGEYQQGRGKLRTKDNKFCCLGVLCDLAVKEGILPEPILEMSHYCYKQDDNLNTHETVFNVLPRKLTDLLHIDMAGTYGEENETLWEENDTHVKSFKEIAQIIRDNSDKLFSHGKN